MQIGLALKEALYQKRMRQTELAEKLGCSKNYIHMVCSDKITVSRLKAAQIADAMGIAPQNLIPDSE